MKEIITARKFRSRIKKEDPELEVKVKDININGVVKGCSGFITNPRNGNVIYVNTEGSCYEPLADKIMYRKAKDTKDYSGGQNRWCHHSLAAKEVAEFAGMDLTKAM